MDTFFGGVRGRKKGGLSIGGFYAPYLNAKRMAEGSVVLEQMVKKRATAGKRKKTIPDADVLQWIGREQADPDAHSKKQMSKEITAFLKDYKGVQGKRPKKEGVVHRLSSWQQFVQDSTRVADSSDPRFRGDEEWGSYMKRLAPIYHALKEGV